MLIAAGSGDSAAETAWHGGRGDSALGDSVLSTDDMSDPTSRHRGYSADDDDDYDDVIPDVTRNVQSLHAQSQRKSGIILQRVTMIVLRFDPRTSATPPLILQGGQICQNFGLIFDFEQLQFRNKATYLTPNTNYRSIDEGCVSSQTLVSFGFPNL